MFKNSTPSTKCITIIDGATIDDVEDIALVNPMYNLIERRYNYFDTTDSLWFYSKHEVDNFHADVANNNAFKSL